MNIYILQFSWAAGERYIPPYTSWITGKLCITFLIMACRRFMLLFSRVSSFPFLLLGRLLSVGSSVLKWSSAALESRSYPGSTNWGKCSLCISVLVRWSSWHCTSCVSCQLYSVALFMQDTEKRKASAIFVPLFAVWQVRSREACKVYHWPGQDGSSCMARWCQYSPPQWDLGGWTMPGPDGILAATPGWPPTSHLSKSRKKKRTSRSFSFLNILS